MLDHIEREATARRSAIATLFGNDQSDDVPATAADPAPSARNRGRKATGGDTEVEVIAS